PYVRLWPPYDMTREAIADLWGRITCPTLLVHGTESWATNPAVDGRAEHFRNARVLGIEKAGHWVHHDQLDVFLSAVRDFLREPDGAQG
ncbi:MAG: alpha/beta hydrolase, partial [Rhodospirillales bacterium]|nr:alpha/beta hydrolase [Rhodospirillales bacterium]